MSLNNNHGCSLCTEPDSEMYETFSVSPAWKGKEAVQYDYRDIDGELFSTVAPTLQEARKKRDEWLNRKNN